MSDDRLQAVGREIRRLRLAAGLSGVELARRAGVPQPTVSRVETGRRVSDAEVVVALLAALGLGSGELKRWSSLVREAYAATAGRRVDAGDLAPLGRIGHHRSSYTWRWEAYISKESTFPVRT